MLLHFSQVETFGGFLNLLGMELFELISVFLNISSMFAIELIFELGAFIFVVFKFFIPEVIEVVHFFLMSFVDFMDLIFVPDLHFINSSLIELFSELFGLDSVVLGFDVVASFFVLGHRDQDLIKF